MCRHPEICQRRAQVRGLCSMHYKAMLRRAARIAAGVEPSQTTAELAEEVRLLLSAGEPVDRVADRLGLSPAAISRRFYRAGDRELARPFERLCKAQRKAA